MSREVIIRIRDDFDGSDADETVSFSYRGQSYEIDLAQTNVERFDKTMQEFIDVARASEPAAVAVAKKSRPKQVKQPAHVVAQRTQIREWAKKQGYEVAERGMIAVEIFDAFEAAHPKIKLFDGTRMTYGPGRRRASDSTTSVSAQDAENGLLTLDSITHAVASAHGTALHPSGRSLSKQEREQIRSWAIENDFDQAWTGKIKSEVIDAYFAAHKRG